MYVLVCLERTIMCPISTDSQTPEGLYDPVLEKGTKHCGTGSAYTEQPHGRHNKEDSYIASRDLGFCLELGSRQYRLD